MAFPGKLTYAIGEPIETKDYSLDNKEELIEKVRNEIEKLRHQAIENLNNLEKEKKDVVYK
jgi:1-acyl-sn-glycerol-3-phosphate acyltransferase